MSDSQTILITGGSGFLGRRLAHALTPRATVVLGARNQKQAAAAERETGCPVLPLDVTRIESVRDTVTEASPAVIIHAAATKFVDRAERNPAECVDVNVGGSHNVARVAIERQVETVIGISTDKAAPPIGNTYGLSKALMERLYCGLDGKADTRFACLRYGNVAWSTGSVLPEWKRMHAQDGVIGTTGPQMRRFFFTVDDAVRLAQTALRSIDEIHGGVLATYMKAALIRDLLDTWIEEKGGRWRAIEGRPGERTGEFLIGEAELPYTRAITIDDAQHYLIDFNRKAEQPLAESLSSANTEQLSREEMVALIEAEAE